MTSGEAPIQAFRGGISDEMEQGLNIERFENAEQMSSSSPWKVYRAIDSETGRWVRLAVLENAGALPPEHGRRCLDWFAEAGYQAQRLDHPAFARVISYRSEAEAAWVAVDAPAGRLLKDKLAEQGAIPPEEAMAVSSIIARALAVAHAAGWAHGYLNSGCVWLDEDVVTICDLGLAIAAQPMFPAAAPYTAATGFLLPDPRRRDMQCLGLMLTEMLTGALPDPVGVPRSELYPAGVPEPAVKRIRALINPQSEEAMNAAEWREYARTGEPESSPQPLTPDQPVVQPDPDYYEPDEISRPLVRRAVSALYAVLAVLVVGGSLYWYLGDTRLPASFTAWSLKVTAPAATVSSEAQDTFTRVQVGPVAPEDEEAMIDRLKALGYPEAYPRREDDGLYIQAIALENADNAYAKAEELRSQGFEVRVK